MNETTVTFDDFRNEFLTQTKEAKGPLAERIKQATIEELEEVVNQNPLIGIFAGPIASIAIGAAVDTIADVLDKVVVA